PGISDRKDQAPYPVPSHVIGFRQQTPPLLCVILKALLTRRPFSGLRRPDHRSHYTTAFRIALDKPKPITISEPNCRVRAAFNINPHDPGRVIETDRRQARHTCPQMPEGSRRLGTPIISADLQSGRFLPTSDETQ